jgi:hypothetical protein
MKLAQNAKTPAEWVRFIRKYRAEMATPENRHAIQLLAALSHQSNFSVGCYCENEAHCHRSVLRQLLAESGANLKSPNQSPILLKRPKKDIFGTLEKTVKSR